MHVDQIWTYPVKSMIGGTVDAVELDERGIVGDRAWATRDLQRGGIRGAKKIGGLMRLAARYIDEPGGHAEITLPDGRTVSTADRSVHAMVSDAIGHPVHLEPLAPPDDLDHYRRGPADSDDIMSELRAVFGREDGEPLPDLSMFPPVVMEFESPPGTYYDAFALTLLTTSALRSMAAAVPDSVPDVRRFRPSFVIDTGDEPGHPELSWPAGKRLQIGGAVVEVIGPCPRCVMVTREISADIAEDRRILRHIVKDLEQNVSAYAGIVQPGPVTVGDPVAFL
jgi:uncharacterized protein YcbX